MPDQSSIHQLASQLAIQPSSQRVQHLVWKAVGSGHVSNQEEETDSKKNTDS